MPQDRRCPLSRLRIRLAVGDPGWRCESAGEAELLVRDPADQRDVHGVRRLVRRRLDGRLDEVVHDPEDAATQFMQGIDRAVGEDIVEFAAGLSEQCKSSPRNQEK